MTRKINRRTFIKKSAVGLGSIAAGNLVSNFVSAESTSKITNISVVEGKDYFACTLKAVEQLGGMQQFVKKGSRVAVLANPQRNNPGAFTKPEIVCAAIRMCKKAEAKEISFISLLPAENWENTGLKKVIDEEEVKLIIMDREDESQFKMIDIPKGKSLMKTRIMNEYFNHDVFINMPITKDHAGNKFTGTLKNLMGINFSLDNRSFHKPDWKTNIDSIRFMDQCIADLNTIILPHLCIVDATEFIITNGPFGPGELLKPQKVIAGVDRVAIDSYCCTLWGLNPKDIISITAAYEHKLGKMDVKKIKIKELKI